MFGDMFTGEGPSAFGMYVMQSDEDRDKVAEYFYGYMSNGLNSVNAMNCALDAVGTSLDNFTYPDKKFLIDLMEDNV